MAKVIGRATSIGIGIEATRGTSVAPAYWVPVTSLGFDDNTEYVDNDSGLGTIAEKNDSRLIRTWGEGDYEGKIFLNSVGAELTALFGASPTSAERGTSDVFDHTFALANNNTHKSLTVAIKDSLLDLRYPMAMINTWTLEVAVDQFVRRTVNLISKKSASASNTVAHTDEIEFVPSQIVFKQAADLAGLDAASAIKITNFSMEINKNAEPAWILGSADPDDVNNKSFAVTGSFEAFFEDTTQRALVLAGTKKALRIDMIDTATDLGTSHNPQLRFDLAKVKLAPFSRDFDNNELLKQTIEFEGLFSIADSAIIAARLTNLVTAYPTA